MNARVVGYWLATALTALPLLGGGFAQFTLNPEMAEGMAQMGYGLAAMRVLGFWKLLVPLALLAPGFPLVKEWTYAGIFFLLTGASWSHYAAGHGVGEVVTPLVILAFAATSYLLRPADRRLASLNLGLEPKLTASSQRT
jgi:hypothetical protein